MATSGGSPNSDALNRRSGRRAFALRSVLATTALLGCVAGVLGRCEVNHQRARQQLDDALAIPRSDHSLIEVRPVSPNRVLVVLRAANASVEGIRTLLDCEGVDGIAFVGPAAPCVLAEVESCCNRVGRWRLRKDADWESYHASDLELFVP